MQAGLRSGHAPKTSHSTRLQLDQCLTSHSTHVSATLINSDVSYTPASTSTHFKETVPTNSGASNFFHGKQMPLRPTQVFTEALSFKAPLSRSNVSQTISRTMIAQTLESMANSINFTSPIYKPVNGYPTTNSTGLKWLAASVLSSSQLPRLRDSSSSVALWPKSAGLCHWDIQHGVLIPPIGIG